MLLYDICGDQSLSPDTRRLFDSTAMRQRSAAAGPKGAPPAIPPIIINPFSYQRPEPAIDPRSPPPSPPIAPPPRPAMSFAHLCFA
jgi:hypothetical protein